MKTIITTDNYEAYLLDYMEGNLSPDEAEQLKAFVVAQGLDWDELTEELPHLEAPQIAYEDKESLKQRSLNSYESRSLSPSKGRNNTKIIPLYVKIASVAAATGLLLTISLWPEKSMPKVEPVAELKPVLPQRLITANETTSLPPRTIRFAQPRVSKKEKHIVSERQEAPLVAQLETQKPQSLTTVSFFEAPDSDFINYRMDTNLELAQIDDYSAKDEIDERDLSLIERGIYRLTEGRHDSFEDLIFAGLTTAKKELTLAATDIALTAYNRADERFEEAKERLEDKWGE